MRLILETVLLTFGVNIIFAWYSLTDVDLSNPDVSGGSKHLCYRTCTKDNELNCTYNFTIVDFPTMNKYCGKCPYNETDCYKKKCITGNGEARMTFTANFMHPGPAILVCENDTIIINVENRMSGTTTSIHWHGMHQNGTAWNDGVPYITQCPIQPGNVFQYKFRASPSGTYFWHGHIGLQQSDGLEGPLIVRKAKDFNNPLYDYDLPQHTVLVTHWLNMTGMEEIRRIKYLSEIYGKQEFQGYDVLINGRSPKHKFYSHGRTYHIPYATFKVHSGKRYRFRFIFNSIVYCPLQVSIDNHKMNVIAVDGQDIKPVMVDSFFGNAGERFDVVISANTFCGRYWIKFHGIGPQCIMPEKNIHVFQLAILEYTNCFRLVDQTENQPTFSQTFRRGSLLNPMQQYTYSYPHSSPKIRVSQLNNTHPTPKIQQKPNFTFYVVSRINEVYSTDLRLTLAQFNNITFKNPQAPLLTQTALTPQYCLDQVKRFNCYRGSCTCPQVQPVPFNKLVEIILIDTDDQESTILDHSLHLHGYQFYVVAMGVVGKNISLDYIRQLDRDGHIHRKLKNAPLKDALSVPALGYAIIRIISSNPGFWFFHCHFGNHVEMKMTMVWKVGEMKDILKSKPPPNLPKCGNFLQDNVTIADGD